MVTYVDTYIHIHTYVYIYIYVYTHACIYICVYIILSVIVFFSSLSFYGEWTIPGTKRQPAILNLIDGVFLISSIDIRLSTPFTSFYIRSSLCTKPEAGNGLQRSLLWNVVSVQID
jgi:hypothetical protein